MSNALHTIDYFVKVTIASDKSTAHISFVNIEDSFTCTSEQLEAVLKAQNVVYGIHYDKLSQIAKNPKDYFASLTLVASGDKPVDGEDGTIKLIYDLERQQGEKRPMELEDGTVDYKEVTSLSNVRKGEMIAERFPATPGLPGKAVTGEEIPPRAGKEARFKVGKNVVSDPEGNRLYTAIDGMIVKTDRDKINVFPIFEVNGDIDFNVGNIDFIGSVIVRGSVLSGFRIKASGDIRVTGSVEAAELDAGGSIEISAGILGQNKGLVKAGHSVRSSFIQDANIEAGEDVLVTQSIMHSNIRAGRNVTCLGTKGLIVGGLIQAGEKVTARTVGNSMSTNTVIEVGVLPGLRIELQQLRTQMRAQADNLDKTDKALTLLDQLAAAGQLSPDKIAMRIKLSHTKKQAQEEQTLMKERMLEIEKSLEDTEKASVEIHSVIYGGAKIVIGRYTRFVKDTTPRVKFRLFEGDITMFSL